MLVFLPTALCVARKRLCVILDVSMEKPEKTHGSVIVECWEFTERARQAEQVCGQELPVPMAKGHHHLARFDPRVLWEMNLEAKEMLVVPAPLFQKKTKKPR